MDRNDAAIFAVGLLVVVSTAYAATVAAVSPRNTYPPSSADEHVEFVTVNVGNVDPNCDEYQYNLCLQDVEDRVASNVQAEQPDVIFFQETVPYDMCPVSDDDTDEVCYNYDGRTVKDQVRRLVGSGYTIVCEPLHGSECIGIREGVGSFHPDDDGRTCPSGYLCGRHHSAQTTAVYEADYVASACDDGFVIMAVEATLRGRDVLLVNGHPDSGDAACRADQLRTVFHSWAPYHSRVIVAGDMNLDPYRDDDESVDVWDAHVDDYDSDGTLLATREFWYHSGVAEDHGTWEPRYTAHYVWPIPDQTLDHVVSNFAYGECDTLSGSANVDGGEGLDHDAQRCDLYFE